MKRLRLQVRRIGPHFRSVLVSGEAGTGKELVARALHGMSAGAGGPFVVCRAAGLEGASVECEASAGPAEAIGRFVKMAHRGTLFLDRVSEMRLEAQDQFVRTLRNHESIQSQVEAPQRVDLRLIASTSEDLRILVSTGRFRRDLYQRLATVGIDVPPLRERMEDLPELVRHFLSRFALLYGSSVCEIACDAMERMKMYRWPVNLRELETVLRNGAMQSEGKVLELHHLPLFTETSGVVDSATSAGESVRLQDVVEQHVLRVLKDCGGNKLRAAEVLGISRSTLYRTLGTGAPPATVD